MRGRCGSGSEPEVEKSGSRGGYLAAHRDQPCQGGMAVLLRQQLNSFQIDFNSFIDQLTRNNNELIHNNV